MTMTREQIISKVQKLLALSDSPNEHEAALAASRAQEFLERHQLTMMDIKEENGQGSGIDVTETNIVEKSNYAWWETLLFTGLESIIGVKSLELRRITTRNGRCTERKIRFVIGLPEDCELFSFTYAYLYKTILRESKKAWNAEKHRIETEYPVLTRPSKASREFYKAYRLGMASRINERMRAEKNRRHEADQTAEACTALVVVKDKAIDEYISKTKGPISHSQSRIRKSTTLNHDAYNQGRRDGKGVNLHAGIKSDRKPTASIAA